MKRPASSRPCFQLFCFPYAGGGGSIFRFWQADAGPSIQVEPVRLPGREGRIGEPPLRSVPELVQTIADQIVPQIRGPFAFFGYSFGALLAFETARRLRGQGLSPERLIVAALKAPHLPLRRKPIHDLPDHEFAAEIRDFRGTPDAVLQNAELMKLVLPAIKADFHAYENYRYQAGEPFDFPITAMGGARDTTVSSDELAAWSVHTCAAFAKHVFPGDHFFLNTERQLVTWTITRELRASLRAA